MQRTVTVVQMLLIASVPPVRAAADAASEHTFVNGPSAAAPAVGPDFTTGWQNLYPTGGTFITATESEHDGLPEHDRFRFVQGFDNPRSGVERFEFSAGISSWSGTMPYLASYLSIDYFGGPVTTFGFDGAVRRFDLMAKYGQTAAGHTFELSPTYSWPLDSRGRTSAWVSLTIAAPIRYTGERSDGIDLGFVRQISRRLRLAVSASRMEVGAKAEISPW